MMFPFLPLEGDSLSRPILSDPYVLDSTMRILGTLRAKLDRIRLAAPVTDVQLGEDVMECLSIVDGAMLDEVQRHTANMVYSE